MPNQYGAPEVGVTEIAQKMNDGESFILLDVRERRELLQAKIDDNRVLVLPFSELAARQLAAIPNQLQDKETEIVVFCHTGVRSAQVTAWMRHQGWTNTHSLAGGIEAYAVQVNPAVGRY